MAEQGFLGRIVFGGGGPLPPPRLLSATAISSTELYVTYNQSMAEDVLDSNNYLLTSQTGVIPNITTIVFYPSGQTLAVKITLDSELTNDAIYTLTASNVHSAAGVLIDPNYDSDDFPGIGEPPFLVGAAAVNGTTIELLFSEEMMVDGYLTEAQYYQFSPNTFSIQSVDVSLNPLIVLTIYLGEMIEGELYTVTVSENLKDLASNFIDPAQRTAQFTGKGVLPQIVAATIFKETVQSRIRIEFSEPMQMPPLCEKTNYSLQAEDPPDNPVPNILSVAVYSSTLVELLTEQFSKTGTYKVIGSSNLVDLVGNPLDPDHNSASFYISATPPNIYVYPTAETTTFKDNDFVRVWIYDPRTEFKGVSLSSINIQFDANYAVESGIVDLVNFEANISGNPVSSEGINFFLRRKGGWNRRFMQIKVSARDLEGAETQYSSTISVIRAGCYEYLQPLSDVETQLTVPLTGIYESLRDVLLRNVTNSNEDYAAAKTVLFLASLTDALVLVSEYIGTDYQDIQLCYRQPILKIDEALHNLYKKLEAAINVDRAIPFLLRKQFVELLESESPITRVSGAAALLIFKAVA